MEFDQCSKWLASDASSQPAADSSLQLLSTQEKFLPHVVWFVCLYAVVVAPDLLA